MTRDSENPAALAGADGVGYLDSDFSGPQNPTRTDQKTQPRRRGSVDFDAVNRAALADFPAFLRVLFPKGKLGRKFSGLNPRRPAPDLSRLKINRHTGRWLNELTGDRGSDVISMTAHAAGLSQREAARLMMRILAADEILRGGGADA